MYVFQGGSYTPDQIQDLFRGLGSDTAILLDGGSSSAIVLRRDTGGMWAGAGVPDGNCDTRQVLCDSRERGATELAGIQLTAQPSDCRRLRRRQSTRSPSKTPSSSELAVRPPCPTRRPRCPTRCPTRRPCPTRHASSDDPSSLPAAGFDVVDRPAVMSRLGFAVRRRGRVRGELVGGVTHDRRSTGPSRHLPESSGAWARWFPALRWFSETSWAASAAVSSGFSEACSSAAIGCPQRRR